MTVQNTLIVTTPIGATLFALLICDYGRGLLLSAAILFVICLEKLKREWSLRLKLSNYKLFQIFWKAYTYNRSRSGQ